MRDTKAKYLPHEFLLLEREQPTTPGELTDARMR